MNKRILLFITCVFIFLALGMRAQDAHFSQFYSNPLYLNPAYAGFDAGTSVILNTRTQWFGVPDGTETPYRSGYNTHSVTVGLQAPCLVRNENITFGFALIGMRDEAGLAPLSTSAFGLAASLELKLASNLLMRAGVQQSRMWKRLRSVDLFFSDQLNPYDRTIADPTNIELTTGGYNNTNVGLLFRGKFDMEKGREEVIYTIGGAIANVNEPNISFYDGPFKDTLSRRFTLHGSIRKEMKSFIGVQHRDPWYLGFQARYDIQAGGDLQWITTGLSYSNQYFSFGTYVQFNPNKRLEVNGIMVDPILANNNTLLSLSAGVNISRLRNGDIAERDVIVGLSYDFQLGGLPTSTAVGTLELSAKVNFFPRRNSNCNGPNYGKLFKNCPVFAD